MTSVVVRMSLNSYICFVSPRSESRRWRSLLDLTVACRARSRFFFGVAVCNPGAMAPEPAQVFIGIVPALSWSRIFILFSAVFTALGLFCFSYCKTRRPAILFLLAQALRQGYSFSRSSDLDPRASDLPMPARGKGTPRYVSRACLELVLSPMVLTAPGFLAA
jgi:hypothetical protein